jgi:hypothetical protein
MAVSARMAAIILKVDQAHQTFLDDLKSKTVAARLGAAKLTRVHAARPRRGPGLTFG